MSENRVSASLGDAEKAALLGAIANEVRRRRGLAAHERIVARSGAVEAVSGVQSSSVELIRQLREGEG